MTGRSRYVTCLDHEVHLMEWGDPAAPAVVAWHGLARNGRDFDALARHLAARYRVLAPDTLGRGLSQWARDPARDYSLARYAAVAEALLDALGVGRARWVGTSMGGLIGIVLAGGGLADRISHLVLNDIGPDVPREGLDRIIDYVGNPPAFDTMGELESYFSTVYRPFGTQDEATWRHLAEHGHRRRDDGRITVHYDPRIVEQFRSAADRDLDLWAAYDAIACPTLLIRGATSDVLPKPTARAMTERGPRARLVEIDGVGHAPMLNVRAQQDVVTDFLDG